MSQSEQNKKKKRAKGNAGKIVLLVVLTLLLVTLLLGWKYVLRNIHEEVTIEVGETVTAEAFLIEKLPLPVELETRLNSLDTTVPGDHPITVIYCGLRMESVLKVRDTVAPAGTVQDLTAFSVAFPEASDFVTSVSDMTDVTVAFSEEPNPAVEEQIVTIKLTDLGGNVTELEAVLTLIFDETAPEIQGASDKTIYIGHEFDLMDGITVTDDLDASPVLNVDDSAFNREAEGTYNVTYTAADASGNESSVTIAITVVDDQIAPEIYGVRALSVYSGGTISYRSNVIVTDETDENPRLSIDSSAVDLSTPGVYPVIYTATDGAGNKTVKETTVTVSEALDSFMDAETIYAAADKVIAKIIREDMSTKAQVQAIYRWVLNECWYSNTMDKTDWLQAAWQMLDRGTGDCFGYYSVTRLLFERLGIPNLSIQRDPSSPRRTTHFWSMVSVDGGLTYYHFDSCPHPKPSHNMCLVTDATLEWFNTHCKGYYVYDKSQYPATPEE